MFKLPGWYLAVLIGHQDEKDESSYKSVFILVIRILRMKPYFNENPCTKLVFFTSLMRIPRPNSFFFILVPLSRLTTKTTAKKIAATTRTINATTRTTTKDSCLVSLLSACRLLRRDSQGFWVVYKALLKGL